jgi:hypothetical protein
MPNWCNNNLNITGDYESLQKFVASVKSTDENGNDRYEILNGLYPIPQELKDTKSGHYTAEPHPNWKVALDNGDMTQEWYDELVSSNAIGYAQCQANLTKYGARDWYDWCCSHWGTKWGDCDTSLNGHGDNHLDFYFDTAWSPPIDGFAHISTMFPTLDFTITYEEGGMGFFGAVRIVNGLTAQSSGEYTDIEGYSELDFCGDDDGDYEKAQDMVLDAKDKCLSDVDGKVLVPLAHPDTDILAVFDAIRTSV